MRTKPDHGEESYVGKGLLSDRAALITGGDSGIGRAVAIACAREGADVAISYLPDEQVDAEETRSWIEKAGRRALLLPATSAARTTAASSWSERWARSAAWTSSSTTPPLRR